MSRSDYERRGGYAREPALAFATALDDHVVDRGGRRFIDLTAGWNVVNAGWNNRAIIDDWLERAAPAMFRPSWCEDALLGELRQALDRIAPGRTAIPGCSGNEAMDNALKVARLVTGLPGLFCFEGAYHGSGTGASLATGYDVPHLAPLDRQDLTVRLPLPCEPDAVERAESLIRGFEAGGAIVYETVVTNMGCETLSHAYRAMLSQVSRELGIVLICDEIGTGMNRLGTAFSSLRPDVPAEIGEPDIVIAGKALTNGLYPLSVCLVRDRMMRQIEPAQFASTYAAMPSGCAAALATLEYHGDHDLGARAERTGTLLEGLLEDRVLGIDGVRRVAGAVLERTVHLDWGRLAARRLSPFTMLSRLREAGVFATLSPGEDHLMVTPPLTIAHEHLDQAIAAVAAVLKGDAIVSRTVSAASPA